jgi:hypothetical protein
MVGDDYLHPHFVYGFYLIKGYNPAIYADNQWGAFFMQMLNALHGQAITVYHSVRYVIIDIRIELFEP